MLSYHDPKTKQDPVKFWNLRDRPFFGFGACHILTGVFLLRNENSTFKGIWIKPRGDFRGNHVIASNGEWAFDFHGYSRATSLIQHFANAQRANAPGWEADEIEVDFDLLCTEHLNANNMRGPDQYHQNPIPRAEAFIDRLAPNRRRLGA